MADTIDPLAGSYYVEALTDELERQAWEYIEKIDALGGSVRAIEQGYIQREIEEAAYRYQCELEEQQRIVVGVNRFQQAEEQHPAILRVDPELGRRQAAQLAALRERRDNAAVGSALAALDEAARGTREPAAAYPRRRRGATRRSARSATPCARLRRAAIRAQHVKTKRAAQEIILDGPQ